MTNSAESPLVSVAYFRAEYVADTQRSPDTRIDFIDERDTLREWLSANAFSKSRLSDYRVVGVSQESRLVMAHDSRQGDSDYSVIVGVRTVPSIRGEVTEEVELALTERGYVRIVDSEGIERAVEFLQNHDYGVERV